MKTKITFERKDFEGMGQILIRRNRDPKAPASYLYKVGYAPGQREPRTGQSKWAVISLQDGQVTLYESFEDFIEDINDGDMRPANRTEIFKAIHDEGNRFPKS